MFISDTVSFHLADMIISYAMGRGGIVTSGSATNATITGVRTSDINKKNPGSSLGNFVSSTLL